MEWKIDSSSMPSFLRIETSGDACPESFVEMWNDVLASKFWRPGMVVLIDGRKLKSLKDPEAFTTAAIEYFVNNRGRIGRACISTISSFPEHFNYARQFQYGIRLRGSDVVLQLFGTETQAVDWLEHYSHLHRNENKKPRHDQNQVSMKP